MCYSEKILEACFSQIFLLNIEHTTSVLLSKHFLKDYNCVNVLRNLLLKAKNKTFYYDATDFLLVFSSILLSYILSIF